MDLIEESDAYYVRTRGRVLGPYSVDQLKALRSRGQFSRANEISTDRKTWQSAAAIEHLLGGAAGAKKSRSPVEEPAEENALSVGPPSRSMTPIWHYAIGDEQCGPVTLLELRGLISSSQLISDDLVWNSGMAEWIPIHDVPELNSLTRSNVALEVVTPKVGQFVSQNFCFACGTPTDARAEVCPKCGVRQRQSGSSPEKSRMTAALLALFVGGVGVHHFYLGNTVRGMIYLLFVWTFIPAIAALVDAIILLCMSDATFSAKYGKR